MEDSRRTEQKVSRDAGSGTGFFAHSRSEEDVSGLRWIPGAVALLTAKERRTVSASKLSRPTFADEWRACTQRSVSAHLLILHQQFIRDDRHQTCPFYHTEGKKQLFASEGKRKDSSTTSSAGTASRLEVLQTTVRAAAFQGIDKSIREELLVAVR